ncbi:type II toxin-antitoxin system VapC family toxin [Stygiolobus sp. CP8521M]|uniref:type II toxin-antitoxin system VapC family toxin n=1 Tax=Stygiolobus sp. CP8521M TaxID=3133136 RepID=UPI00307E54D1
MIFLDANFLIYLNSGVSEVKEYYIKLLTYESLFSDPLVIDEVIYVSKKKYGVKHYDTIEFLDEIVLKYLTVLPITIKEYERAKEIMRKYSVKPSDAFHIAVMLNNSINVILSEDKELDKVAEIKRIWIR